MKESGKLTCIHHLALMIIDIHDVRICKVRFYKSQATLLLLPGKVYYAAKNTIQ